METIWQDLRYALRVLRNHPGFTVVAILTLALGIGANAAIFTLTDAVLLQSLPVKDPNQLSTISSYNPKRADINNSFSYPMYQDLRDKNDVFAGVIARGGAQMNVSYEGRNDRVRGELVSGNYFEVLGVKAWAGRLFTQDDDRTPGAHPVAVLSYGFWSRRFAKDTAVIGKTILVNEYPLTVVGVTPPGFYGIEMAGSPDVQVPLMMTPVFNPIPKNRLQRRQNQWLTIMARRKDGITVNQAQASLSLLYQQILENEAQKLPADTSASDRQDYLSMRMQVGPGNQGFQRLQREMRAPLLLLFGATSIVLLILSANLANLVLARDATRDQEISVRLALGAGRFRLLRQWLTEAILLSLFGAVAGTLVALWVKAALLSYIPADYRMNLDSPLGWRFVGFTLLASLLVGIGIGLAPALRAARSSAALALHGEARTFVSGGGLFSLRNALILVQVSLSLPLLIGATLLLSSLHTLRGVDPGFVPGNILIASINPALNGYSPDKTHSFYQELLAALRSTPGVQSASLASDSPLAGSWDLNGIVVEGYEPSPGERMTIQRTGISTDYFRALGISLVAGRDFNEQDTIGTPPVVIINQQMARYFFGATNPIGKKIGLEKVPDTVIIGVVSDVRHRSLREPPIRQFYQPINQEPRLFDLTMHIKTLADPNAVVSQVRATVQKLDPHLPLYDMKTLAAQIDESLTQERLVTWLCTAFGLLAALLTALGLYGVLAFSVAQRTREIGIRVALGAQARDVFKLIIGQGMLVVTAGVALGLAVSFAITRLIASLLFGVGATNASTFVLVSLGLGIVALFACYLPARRATKVDPLVALRYE